jgi:hypothetical protein
VLDYDKGLAFRIYSGPVERMARDDFDVLRQVLLECCQLRRFARGLTTNDGTHLRRWAIFSYDSFDQFSFDTVDDPIADS